MYPESLKKLIESFKLFPGVGEKSAERFSFCVLDFDKEQVDLLATSLIEVKDKIHKCCICNTLTDNDMCSVCSNSLRDNTLCVVENSKYVFLFEKMGLFNGKYHVLDGLISPLDGINPEDIGLDKMIDRIQKEKFSEIILAFKPSIEGETTALYIKKILSDMDIRVTRPASGLPIGIDMEYVDSLTLERALKDRKDIE